MAIYRFRVSFEDYDDVLREIDIRSNQTFEDLHQALHKSTGYDPEKPSSFYVSSDQWLKGDEIAYLPVQRKIDIGIILMSKSKLSSFIDDPHQKFYYIYNFEKPYDFHVELIKILLNEESGKNYPFLFRSVGEAPKPSGFVTVPTVIAESEDFDFLNEMEYAPEDADDLETVDELGQAVDVEEEEEDKGGFMDDSDSGFDADDIQKEEDY